MRTESLDLSLASVAGSRMEGELFSASRSIYPPRMPPPSSARSEGEEVAADDEDTLFPAGHKPSARAVASARAARASAEDAVVPVLSDQERATRILADAMVVGERLPVHTTPHQRDALRRAAAPPSPLLQSLYARPGATAAVIAVVAAAVGYALAKQSAGRGIRGGRGSTLAGPSVPCSAAVDRMLRFA